MIQSRKQANDSVVLQRVLSSYYMASLPDCRSNLKTTAASTLGPPTTRRRKRFRVERKQYYCRRPTAEAEERTGEHNSGTGEAEETFRLEARPPPTFSVGDRVLKYNRRRDTRKGDKLEKRYQSPYIIVEVMGKGTYRLTTANGLPVKVLANSRDLKHFTGDA